MALNNTEDATTTTTARIGFFSLPRELRDQVYELMYQDNKRKKSYSTPRNEPDNEITLTQRSRLPQLRLISRQFKREYDEYPPAESHLRVHMSTFEMLRMFDPQLRCPGLSRRATELEIHSGSRHPDTQPWAGLVSCVPCAEFSHLTYDELWWFNIFLYSATAVKKIRVFFHTRCQEVGTPRWEACVRLSYPRPSCLDQLVAPVDDLEDRRIPHVEVEVCWVVDDLQNESTVQFATWTVGNGLEVDVEASELCGELIRRM